MNEPNELSKPNVTYKFRLSKTFIFHSKATDSHNLSDVLLSICYNDIITSTSVDKI